MPRRRLPLLVRPTRPDDFDAIIGLSRRIYPDDQPWDHAMLGSHLRLFPQGQLVAVDPMTNRLLGSASSLIVAWDDYRFDEDWNAFTATGWFTNHDPAGRTLYGADLMVDPASQGRGVGKAIYTARWNLVLSLSLLRVRAGARLAGYHHVAHRLTPRRYVLDVIAGRLTDPTLSFQLKRGFRVIAVAENYLRHDPKSHGHAAVIERINHTVAKPPDYRRRDPSFAKPRNKNPPIGGSKESLQ